MYEMKLFYLEPKGMINERSSAHWPQAILLAWNNDTHVAITINQMSDPIAENITSENESSVKIIK